MPYPPLRFAAQFKSLIKNKHIDRKWQYLKRSNIVHHTSTRPSKNSYLFNATLYRNPPPIGLRACPLLVAANLDASKGRNPHYRIRTCPNDGKFLIFGTGNIIIAGTKSHSSAALASARMMQLLSKESPGSEVLWPSLHSAPNAVITGQLVHTVNPSIRASPLVNVSAKFPGIAIRVKKKGITPELYLRRGMVIIPGITSARDLLQAVEEIVAVVDQHQ